jgi:hypothetical protein
MAHSTLPLTRHQYLRAFRALFPPRLLKRAVACRPRVTRCRLLPLFLLLAVLILAFFQPDAGLPAVVGGLLHWSRWVPTDASIYRARGRLGWAPLRWLCRHVVRPLACSALDPSAFYQGRHLLAIDGTTLTIADTPANVRIFGRPYNQHRSAGYPLARVVSLCELGTHALIDWVARGYHRSEVDLARRLLRRIPRGSLLLADRNFHSFEWWQTALQGGYDLLIRVQKGPKLPVHEVFPDGSYRSVVYPRRGKHKKNRGISIRVIGYQWTDDQGQRQISRVATSLVDAVAHPAAQLVDLYHRRWEHELVLGEVKDQLSCRPMHIRAKEPLRVCQEIDALLLGHYVVRWVMLQAAREAGVAPVKLSFTGSLRVLEGSLARIPQRVKRAKRWWAWWWREVRTAVGRQRLRARGRRSCPRVRKVTRSHWPVKKHQKEGTIPKLEIVPAVADSSP